MADCPVGKCLVCWGKKAEVAEYPRVTRILGNPASPILYLAAQPRLIDIKNNLPISGKLRYTLSSLFEEVGLVMDRDMCTVNLMRCHSDKLRKRCVDNCEPYYAPYLKQKHVRFVIGEGHPVAKFLFGRGGAVPQIDSMAGKPVRLFDMPGKVVFFIRDPRLLFKKDQEDGEYEQLLGQLRLNVKKFKLLINKDKETVAWLTQQKSTA